MKYFFVDKSRIDGDGTFENPLHYIPTTYTENTTVYITSFSNFSEPINITLTDDVTIFNLIGYDVTKDEVYWGDENTPTETSGPNIRVSGYDACIQIACKDTTDIRIENMTLFGWGYRPVLPQSSKLVNVKVTEELSRKIWKPVTVRIT